MKPKNTTIIGWFLCQINFSVGKLIMYSVVKCFNFEINDFLFFNFISIYKRKGVFLLMVYSISDLDLNFCNMNDELPCELTDVIKDTITETAVVCPEYVIGNHFTENSELSLAEFAFFFIFREGKTLQSDIEMFMSNFKTDVEPFSRQYLSYIRNLIQPKLFKDINHNFLCNINYSPYTPGFNTYKGFFLYGCDGSDEKLPDFPEVHEIQY